MENRTRRVNGEPSETREELARYSPRVSDTEAAVKQLGTSSVDDKSKTTSAGDRERWKKLAKGGKGDGRTLVGENSTRRDGKR